jgi:hypothetical protein
MTKNNKKNPPENSLTYPKASIKDAQATGETFGLQKRTSSISKYEFFVAFFVLLDLNPADQNQSDPVMKH